jgi:uncharacterized lipoprotein YmbA
MHAVRNAIRLIPPLTVLSLVGCFSLGRSTPPMRYYVLGADAPPTDSVSPAPTGMPAGTVIGLLHPKLAEYLETPFIVVREGPHQIGFSEFHRWGETLERGITRTVAGYMTARNPSWRVSPAPWPPGAQPAYLIQLHFLHFEGVAPEKPVASHGEAHVLATWELLRQEDGAVLARGTTEVHARGWTEGDFEGLVGLLDAGLARLAEDLVLRLERVLAP